MVFVPYPRVDLDNHENLLAWRKKVGKKEGDWKELKVFLEEQPRFFAIHKIPKCWYTELPQGDNYALDVEHFRPKNQASPLNTDQLKIIEKKLGYSVFQELTEWEYSWLEFDYRNYRLTTALPNRGGAKHVFFPIAQKTERLKNGEFPWTKSEYPLLLDPTNLHDSKQLLVLPNGLIIPRAKREELILEDFDDIDNQWLKDGFNYLRATITIELYRLNERFLVAGRKERFETTDAEIDTFIQGIIENVTSNLQDKLIKPLILSVLPSAPFSLASRCAMEAYIVDPTLDALVIETVNNNLRMILQRVEQDSIAKAVDWNKP